MTERLQAALQNAEADLARREESLSMAVARADALQAQLAAKERQEQAESEAIAEARAVALRLKGQADKLQAERDEARALARQLHQKLASAKADRELTDLRPGARPAGRWSSWNARGCSGLPRLRRRCFGR